MIVFSLLAGLIPHILTFFNGILDRRQELAVMRLQMQNSKDNMNMQLQEVSMNAQLTDKSIMYNEIKTSSPFIDGINGLVRPIIALLYTGTMFCSIFCPDMVNMLEFNEHIMMAIIGFYFGGLVKYK